MLKLINVSKSFFSSDEQIDVLKNIHIEIVSGELVAIMGPSGSGKSTLLGIAAGLDKADSGDVFLDNINLSKLQENKLCKIRSQKIGFIFQNFQLIKNLTALDNVCLPLIIGSNQKESEIKQKAIDMLEKVSLGHRLNHFPNQLSGGEEQRVAIARSFINDPMILFADEPTGNLDSLNGQNVMKLLKELNLSKGSTMVIVTHDPKVASMADRIYEMEDGKIANIIQK